MNTAFVALMTHQFFHGCYTLYEGQVTGDKADQVMIQAA